MNNFGTPSEVKLDSLGLVNLRNAYWNLPPPALVEKIVERHEGELSPQGAVLVNTGAFTGRSANDKYIVKNGDDGDTLIWWGKINQSMDAPSFDQLHRKMLAYFQGRDVFVQDLRAGAHPDHTLPIRVITEKAWHSLFARDLFVRPPLEEAIRQTPEFTVLQAPDFIGDPSNDHTRSSTFIAVSFSKRLILIGNTGYAGEIKKSIFTVMNYILPQKGILSMHCSANVGHGGDVALFFGLSGTGKTTLSSDPHRHLIGDDEHGWSDENIFNFEGGCYAKTVRLSKKLEPIIWDASQSFGSVLENVIFDPKTRALDFDDIRLTENTRAAYPLEYVPGHVEEGYAGHPNNIFFLSADAFGVLPPISRLSPEQAMYYFLSGYTAKLAGTEKGLGSEPQATFSTCFGAPFLPLHPSTYARLLGEKIKKHNVQVWLVNTGWIGGAYGQGDRIKLPYTRQLIQAALTHQFDAIPMRKEPYFGLDIPTECPGVPSEILDPRQSWPDPEAYAPQAHTLIARFKDNFKQFENEVLADVVKAGPIG